MPDAVPYYDRKGLVVSPPERYVTQDSDAIFDPATLPENRELLKMLAEYEAQEDRPDDGDEDTIVHDDGGAHGASGDTGGTDVE